MLDFGYLPSFLMHLSCSTPLLPKFVKQSLNVMLYAMLVMLIIINNTCYIVNMHITLQGNRPLFCFHNNPVR